MAGLGFLAAIVYFRYFHRAEVDAFIAAHPTMSWSAIVLLTTASVMISWKRLRDPAEPDDVRLAEGLRLALKILLFLAAGVIALFSFF